MQLTVHWTANDTQNLLRFATRKAGYAYSALRWLAAIYLICFPIILFTSFWQQATFSIILKTILTDYFYIGCIVLELLISPQIIENFLFSQAQAKGAGRVAFPNATYKFTGQGVAVYNENGALVQSFAFSCITQVYRTNSLLIGLFHGTVLFALPLRCFQNVQEVNWLEAYLSKCSLFGRAGSSSHLNPKNSSCHWRFTYVYDENIKNKAARLAYKACRTSLIKNPLFWIFFLFIAYLVWSLFFATPIPTPQTGLILAVLLLFTTLIGLLMVLYGFSPQSISAMPPYRFEQCTLEVKENGIQVSNSHVSTLLSWQQISAIASGQKGALLLWHKTPLIYIPYNIASFNEVSSALDFIETKIHESHRSNAASELNITYSST